jgi:hypothetical protein
MERITSFRVVGPPWIGSELGLITTYPADLLISGSHWSLAVDPDRHLTVGVSRSTFYE